MNNSHIRWDRNKLTKMLFHNYYGTIADNVIEIGWVLCFSLIANKVFVEKVTTLFGLNDSFWVILSSTYYTARTSLNALLPRLLIEKGNKFESRIIKNHIYLFYLMLLPLGTISFIFMEKLLLIMGVLPEDISLYLPYFRLSIISILISAPWAVFIPGYLRTIGKSKEATFLDHLIAWSMIGGIFFTTHILNKGILWALIVNIITNAIPLYWFLYNKPVKNFFKSGIEFDIDIIKQSWKIVKWELIRRLSPRLSALISASLLISYNPIFLAVKYWISNITMVIEGWIDALAGLLNSHSSKNVGLKEEYPYSDHSYLFNKSIMGLFISILISYLIVYFGLRFLPNSIYNNLINPYIYIFLLVENISKLRYYMWLSISRTGRPELNGIAQLLYAIPTIILTPLLTYFFIYLLKIDIIGIFLVGSIVGLTQIILTEIYFRKHSISLK